MFILFFTIVFIAELIVVSWLVGTITRTDTAVCRINSQVREFGPKVRANIKNIREINKKILSGLDCFLQVVEQKHHNCKQALTQGLIATIAGFLFKIPVKKIFTVINIFMTIKKFTRKG